jgi:hypothetical protein
VLVPVGTGVDLEGATAVASRNSCRPGWNSCCGAPEQLLWSVGTSAGARRNKCWAWRNHCGRIPEHLQDCWNYCCGVLELLLSCPGTSAVASRHNCCRLSDLVQEIVGTAAECNGTGAVACWNVCSRLSDDPQDATRCLTRWIGTLPPSKSTRLSATGRCRRGWRTSRWNELVLLVSAVCSSGVPGRSWFCLNRLVTVL